MQSLQGCLEEELLHLPLSKQSSDFGSQLEESCYCRFGMTSWVLALNEMSTELERLLPATDTRLRADIRALEQGRYDQVRPALLGPCHSWRSQLQARESALAGHASLPHRSLCAWSKDLALLCMQACGCGRVKVSS